MIHFNCACGAKLEVRNERAGKQSVCPECDERVTIPPLLRSTPQDASRSEKTRTGASFVTPGAEPRGSSRLIIGGIATLVILSLLVGFGVVYTTLSKPAESMFAATAGTIVNVPSLPENQDAQETTEKTKTEEPKVEEAFMELIKGEQRIAEAREQLNVARAHAKAAQQQDESDKRAVARVNQMIGAMSVDEQQLIERIDKKSARGEKLSKWERSRVRGLKGLKVASEARKQDIAEGAALGLEMIDDAVIEQEDMDDAHAFIGSLDDPEELRLKNIEENRKKGERLHPWEIQAGMHLAPLGTKLYRAVRLQARQQEAALASINAPSKRTQKAESVLKAQLHSRIEQIALEKSVLKQAKIADDAPRIAKQESKISDIQSELHQFVKMKFSSLDPEQFEVGQCGNLSARTFRVLKIINEANGEVDGALVKVKADSTPWIQVRIVGFDSQRILSFEPLNLKNAEEFIVVGKTADGRFELHACNGPPPFSEDEIKTAEEAAAADYSLNFSDDEQLQMKTAITKHVSDTKQRRSQSFLDSGKILLNKGNSAAAKKQFEKSIAEDPESETAKTAAMLLDRIK